MKAIVLLLGLLIVLLGCNLTTAILGVPSTCEVELVGWSANHSVVLIHAQPEIDIQQPVAALGGICRNSYCPTSLPVVGRLMDSDDWYQVLITPDLRISENWYRMDYEASTAWVTLEDDGRLVGDCDGVPVVTVGNQE